MLSRHHPFVRGEEEERREGGAESVEAVKTLRNKLGIFSVYKEDKEVTKRLTRKEGGGKPRNRFAKRDVRP